MTRNVVGVLVVVVVLAGVAALSVVLLWQGAPETARAYPTREEGCRDLLRRGLLNTDISKRVAMRDRDRLTEELLLEPNSGVVMVGRSTCAEQWILLVGVYPDHVPVPARGPGGTPVIILGFQDPRSPGYPSIPPSATPSAFPHPPGTAGVYPTFEEGCRDLLRRDIPKKDVSQRVASRDADRLGEQLITEGSGVNLLGVGKCGERWVLRVGVATAETTVPEQGPGGTPVIAYLQDEFRTF